MEQLYKNKKQNFFILVLVVFVLITVCLLRFSTPEDFWACKNGNWVKHGRPNSALPTAICPPSNSKIYTASDVVNYFYNWYFHNGDTPIINGFYNNSDFLTQNYKNKIGASYRSNNRVISDPFICNHTENPISFSTQEIYNRKNRAFIMVYQNYASIQDRVEVSLVNKNGFWYIDNINCAKPFSSFQNIDLASKSNTVAVTNQISLYYSNLKSNTNANDCSEVFIVTRKSKTANPTVKEALSQLFIGPTQNEKNQGYTSWFSAKTKNILKDVVVKNGTAYIDFIDIRKLIPSVSSSCGYTQFNSSITKTVSALGINKVVYSINGNTKTFYNWVQQTAPQM